MTRLRAAAIWARPWDAPPVWGGELSLSGARIGAVTAAEAQGDAILIPGLVNAHDHGRGLRPLAYGAPDAPLEAWLWDLWRQPKTDPYLTALVAFGRMALSGVATVVHNHLPQTGDWLGEAKAVAQAARDIGLRLGFVVPILDRNLAGYDGGAAVKAAVTAQDWAAIEHAQALPPVEEQIALVGEIADAIDGPDVITQFGPPGPQWLGEKGLTAVAQAAEQSGRRVHLHLLETRLQRSWLDAECPEGAHVFLERAGLLNNRLTVAHGVFLRPGEIAALSDAGVALALNTSSNLRLFSGTADGSALLGARLPLGIGLDGMGFDDDADILRELRLTAALLGPRRFDTAGLSRSAILRAGMATGRTAFDGAEGQGLLPMAQADVVALSLQKLAYDQIDPAPEALAGLIMGRASRSAVRDVWVAGRQIVKDGAVTGADLPGAERALVDAARATYAAPDWASRARAACVAASTPKRPT